MNVPACRQKEVTVTPSQEIAAILQFFSYQHLPPVLQDASRPFCELARDVASRSSGNPEAVTALRKLLEAKDAAVRSILFKPAGDP